LVFPKQKTPDPHRVRWWTPLCDATLSIIHISHRGDHM
jgi:hypothetical protein